MGKNIAFCADGTWHGPSQVENSTDLSGATNVLKLFMNLSGDRSVATAALADEEESVSVSADGAIEQVAKYINGVGDSDNFLAKILGGTLGVGLIQRIVRGYTFVSRNYSGPDDRIFLVGFSRGAYTVRALAGLIAAKGLMDRSKLDLEGDKTSAYRWGSAVWFDYASRRSSVSDLGAFESLFIDLPRFFFMPVPGDKLIPDVKIQTVGVWDTVGALGIPEYATENNARVQSLQFVDLDLAPSVRKGFHALSIDERRADFTPALWNAREGVTQCLFAGAHSDVGGGYPLTDGESGLSDIALDWMSTALGAEGLRFRGPSAYAANPSATGCAHRPWDIPPWRGLLKYDRVFPLPPRSVPAGCEIDASVRARMAAAEVRSKPPADSARYQPANIG